MECGTPLRHLRINRHYPITERNHHLAVDPPPQGSTLSGIPAPDKRRAKSAVQSVPCAGTSLHLRRWTSKTPPHLPWR